MRISITAFALLSQLASASRTPTPQHNFSNHPDEPGTDGGYRIPTVRESAAMARRMLRLEKLGTLSTVFPKSDSASTLQNRPDSVAGLPFGLMEYFADCEPQTGNPTILAVNITSTYRNVVAGSNITLSLRFHPNTNQSYSAAKLARFALIGTLEDLTEQEIKTQSIKSCFSKYHPDSVIWQPGNDIHTSHWVRLAVKEVYWFGGFGDRAYIGWIPLETWQNITEEEIQKIRIPGERT
ncbi:FMN binding [Venturia nashicola]|uniref:FMN binding n=1 Tax=Venturia nashicola TaxID=86259 RepID=A0A4Z1PD11_9PEZI|nr:FMN binding [Venturia nashicola]TLD30173.1 FMN binding [Venturia nashicola]